MGIKTGANVIVAVKNAEESKLLIFDKPVAQIELTKEEACKIAKELAR